MDKWFDPQALVKNIFQSIWYQIHIKNHRAMLKLAPNWYNHFIDQNMHLSVLKLPDSILIQSIS